jgi:pimeloyl-ACP methyl ester carboxylesterase
MRSAGKAEQAWDLVEDGRACLNYMTTKLGARPEHVLLFGHSIGGAVAAQLRADHSPSGPLVLDRTFSTLGAAGTSVFSSLCKVRCCA